MDLIGGSVSFRYFKIISVNNKKVKDEGRYKTRGSPGDAAKKAFTQLSKKYNTNKLTFSIKETTQGSTKKEYGPYLGEKTKLKKPLEVKYKGKKKPVLIKYETKIHLVKDHKQKGGRVTNEQLKEFEKRLGNIQATAVEINPYIEFNEGPDGYLGKKDYDIISKFKDDFSGKNKRDKVAEILNPEDLEKILNAERMTLNNMIEKKQKRDERRKKILTNSSSNNGLIFVTEPEQRKKELRKKESRRKFYINSNNTTGIVLMNKNSINNGNSNKNKQERKNRRKAFLKYV